MTQITLIINQTWPDLVVIHKFAYKCAYAYANYIIIVVVFKN